MLRDIEGVTACMQGGKCDQQSHHRGGVADRRRKDRQHALQAKTAGADFVKTFDRLFVREVRRRLTSRSCGRVVGPGMGIKAAGGIRNLAGAGGDGCRRRHAHAGTSAGVEDAFGEIQEP